VLDTGETRDLVLPDNLRDQKLAWSCGAWFPDSTKFLANTLPSEKIYRDLVDGDATIWLVSVVDGVPRKLGLGFAWAVSPDGNLIAFAGNKGRLGPREIWLMDANGQHARKLFESEDEGAIGWLSWTSDRRHVTYAKINDEARELKWISRDLEGGPPVCQISRPEDADFGRDWSWVTPHGLFGHDARHSTGLVISGLCATICAQGKLWSNLDG
jgi:Tol biopolymer transport system component